MRCSRELKLADTCVFVSVLVYTIHNYHHIHIDDQTEHTALTVVLHQLAQKLALSTASEATFLPAYKQHSQLPRLPVSRVIPHRLPKDVLAICVLGVLTAVVHVLVWLDTHSSCLSWPHV